MATMGKYCKAYLLKDFRAYDQWSENGQNTRKEEAHEAGHGEAARRELTDDSILYLQENYIVTDGVYKDENIIFEQVTPEWIAFCRHTLRFEIPDYATENAAQA